MWTVVQDYDPVEPNDIALHVGDTFNKVKDIGNGWAVGTNTTTGDTGVFPEAYLKKQDTINIAGGFIRRITTKKPKKTKLRLEEGIDSEAQEGRKVETIIEGDDIPDKRPNEEDSRLSTQLEKDEEIYANADAVVSMQINKIETYVPDDTEVDDEFENDLTEDEDDNAMAGDDELMIGSVKKPKNITEANTANPSLKQKLFQSDRGEFQTVKAVAGAICGLIAGVLLFVMLVFSFKFGYDIAGYIALPFTLFSCIGLGMSVHARCIGFLLIPSLTTGKGRAALLSIIFGLLLTGPITNISNNATKVSESMACSTQLIYNQSYALKEQLQEPINEISNKVEESARLLKSLGNGILTAWEPIKKGINAINNGIQATSDALTTAAAECKRVFTDSYNKCVKEINGAKTDCVNAFNSIPVVGKRRRRKRHEADSYLRRHRYIYLAMKRSGMPSHRFRRALSDICNVLDISDVCKALNTFKGVCSPVEKLDEIANSLANAANDKLDEIKNWFTFDVTKELGLSGVVNFTKSVAEFVSEVKLDLDGKTIWVIFSVNLVSKLLALTLLLLILQSFHYIKSYLSKDEYNNIYITSLFKMYDRKRKKEGKPHVLPLDKQEKKLYIDTTSLRMGKAEMLTSGIGMAQILLHMLIALVICFFDYVLYFCLALVAQYSKVNISISGQSRILLRVTGSGAIAKLLQELITGIDLKSDYEADYNITTCLPVPSEPQYNQVYIYIFLYSLTVICAFLEAYGLRLRRKICAYYYPEQERDRIMYLHRKIRHHRKAAQMKVESYRKIMKS